MYRDESIFSKEISGFPGYYVTVYGRVFNTETGREMTLSPTMQGELTVGLMRNGRQYRRSVKVLVAKAFIDGESEIFDTPILLDGDKGNLHVDNIRWRPRWFAWEYIRQFTEEQPDWFLQGPIYDTVYGVTYETIFDAAMINGSLCKQIHESLIDGSRVFPNGERYVRL